MIGAWSKEIIIVEAGVKSGALWTTKFAERQKREADAVRHLIYSLEGKSIFLGCLSPFVDRLSTFVFLVWTVGVGGRLLYLL